MTFDWIVEIGRKKKPNANTVVEDKNGYVFSFEEDKGYDGGLGHSAVVVLKDGTATGMILFTNQ